MGNNSCVLLTYLYDQVINRVLYPNEWLGDLIIFSERKKCVTSRKKIVIIAANNNIVGVVSVNYINKAESVLLVIKSTDQLHFSTSYESQYNPRSTVIEQPSPRYC